MASRYALQYMCNHMGIKAAACGNLNAHGKTLIMQTAGFMSLLPVSMNQSPGSMEFMKSVGRHWRRWRKKIILTWITSAGRYYGLERKRSITMEGGEGFGFYIRRIS